MNNLVVVPNIFDFKVRSRSCKIVEITFPIVADNIRICGSGKVCELNSLATAHIDIFVAAWCHHIGGGRCNVNSWFFNQFNILSKRTGEVVGGSNADGNLPSRACAPNDGNRTIVIIRPRGSTRNRPGPLGNGNTACVGRSGVGNDIALTGDEGFRLFVDVVFLIARKDALRFEIAGNRDVARLRRLLRKCHWCKEAHKKECQHPDVVFE